MHEVLRIAVMVEVIAVFVTPVIAGLLLRRGAEVRVQFAAVLSVLFGLVLGTSALYFSAATTLDALALQDWLRALGLVLLGFGIAFPVARWTLNQWSRAS